MDDPQPVRRSGKGANKAIWNALFMAMLVIVFTPLRYFLPVIALVVIPVGYFYGCFLLLRFNRLFGLVVIGTTVVAVSIYASLIHLANTRDAELVERLSSFDDVTVRRNYFPLPSVYQLSIESNLEDAELSKILKFEGLERLSHLSLESNQLTDACLEDVSKVEELTYLFINCKQITDDALLAFESRVPNCMIVAYMRELHGPPNVFLGPP